MDKLKLRQDLKRRRALLSNAERLSFATAAADHLMGISPMASSRRIGLYRSVRDELSTEPLFRQLLEAGREVFFPKMDQMTGALNWGASTDLSALVKGPFGIPEPTKATSDTASLDMIVVPGLGFGLKGGRLGYGAGWYDRTLEHFKGQIIGFGFECQVLDAVPVEGHDRSVHWIVTELRAIPIES